MFDYFHTNENEQYLFLQLPLMLLRDEKFKELSDGAKILYSLFLNRTSLSRKNNWADENGHVYIIYTIEEITEDLNCWEKKAVKAVRELKEVGLIKTVRRGMCKPNLIYVMNFATELKYQPKDGQRHTKESKEPTNPVNTLNGQNDNSGTGERKNQELSKAQCINKDLDKHIESKSESESKSDTTASDSLPEKEKADMTLTSDGNMGAKEDFFGKEKRLPMGCPQCKASDPPRNPYPVLNYEEKYNASKAIIQENIQYRQLLIDHPYRGEEIDELVNCMLDVICTEGDTVRINGEDKNRAMVKSQYFKVNSEDIEHVMDKYKEQRHRIKRPNAYLKTMLFTVKQEHSHFYTNAVSVDGAA